MRLLLSICGLSLGLGCFASYSAAGEAPPTQLRGKSIVVSWAERRIQRDEGQKNFRPLNANRNITIYISTLGRVFSRATNTTQLGSGGSDQVQGESSSAHARPRIPSFSGQSMTYYQPMGPTGMRRLVIDFDGSFGSCTAKASWAKRVGASTSIDWSPITKRMVEFQSVTMSGETCSVRDGNVFGNK
jgi:hypothetical protein